MNNNIIAEYARKVEAKEITNYRELIGELESDKRLFTEFNAESDDTAKVLDYASAVISKAGYFVCELCDKLIIEFKNSEYILCMECEG